MKKILILLFSCLLISFTKTAYSCDFGQYVGYEIIYQGVVTGYIDENGYEKDDFEGCDWGRVLIIDYIKKVTCSSWNWNWSFLPDIIILSNGSFHVACIENEIYDINL